MSSISDGRVIFVIPTFAGGGAEHIVSTIARQLHNRGRHVLVVGLLERAGSRVEGLPSYGLGCTQVRHALRRLPDLIQSGDIVVSTLKHVSVIVSLVQVATLFRFKHVIRVANNYSRELSDHSRLSRSFWSLALRFCHRLAERTISVSSGVRLDLIKNFGLAEKRVIHIPNPIDISEIQQLSRARNPLLAHSQSRKLVLAVGRLTRQKNFSVLLAAFKKFSDQYNQLCELIILGEGPERSLLERLILSLQLQDRVRMPGWVDNP